MSVATALDPSAPAAVPGALSDPLPVVRRTVRALLESTPAYARLGAAERAVMANSMVRVAHAAALLVREELECARTLEAVNEEPAAEAPGAPPFALAQAAEVGASSAQRVAGVTQAVLNAVSFPRFVSELITGVFRAITESSIQQMNSYIELLNGVAASIEGFEGTAVGDGGARAWLAERYPGSFELSGSVDPDETEPDPEDREQATLRLRPGAAPPAAEVLRVDLGLGPADPVPTGDPERVLVPLARRRLAKTRQEMLATMVMMGMQRIVVDGGRINASMRFHIDTRSATQQDRGNRSEFGLQTGGSGSFGVGAWGASASLQTNIAYVSTERTQTTEELNTDLELTSGVEVVFKSDYVPLERLATGAQVERIKLNTRNPEAEAAAAAAERGARGQRQTAAETARRSDLALAPTPVARPTPGSPGTTEAADRLRQEAAAKEGPAKTTTPPAAQTPAPPAADTTKPAKTPAPPGPPT